MTVLRTIAVLLFVLAGLMLVTESISAAIGGTTFRMRSFGEWWYALSPSLLNGAQAFVQRYLWAGLWDPFIIFFLRLPGIPVTAGLAAIFMTISVVRSRDR